MIRDDLMSINRGQVEHHPAWRMQHEGLPCHVVLPAPLLPTRGSLCPSHLFTDFRINHHTLVPFPCTQKPSRSSSSHTNRKSSSECIRCGERRRALGCPARIQNTRYGAYIEQARSASVRDIYAVKLCSSRVRASRNPNSQAFPLWSSTAALCLLYARRRGRVQQYISRDSDTHVAAIRSTHIIHIL